MGPYQPRPKGPSGHLDGLKFQDFEGCLSALLRQQFCMDFYETPVIAGIYVVLGWNCIWAKAKWPVGPLGPSDLEKNSEFQHIVRLTGACPIGQCTLLSLHL